MNGAWWGNDTCWRMSVDIARIIAYSDRFGNLTSHQRTHLVLIDGIVGGEGNGPLNVQPVKSGAILFADNPIAADYAAASIMGYSPKSIPTIRRVLELKDFPLFTGGFPGKIRNGDGGKSLETGTIYMNGNKILIRRLADHVKKAYLPSKGWHGHIKTESKDE